MASSQLDFFSEPVLRPHRASFVSTRFQGSKNRLTEWIWSKTAHLKSDSVLDLFGGTGAVSHMFKAAGRRVIYNDVLKANWQIGSALVENASTTLSQDDVESILARHPHINYPTLIADIFSGIYFTDDENVWLDQTIRNIDLLLNNSAKENIARFAVYQSCIIKRPYNLFHRANLYMSTADVKRSFGNAATWNKPFEHFFRKFVREANLAIFDNGRENRALNLDDLDVGEVCDLIYMDPPYVSDKGTSTDYFGFYQFLEGLAEYEAWAARIDHGSKNLAIPSPQTPWVRKNEVSSAFLALIEKYANRTIVISYRDDGIPSIDDLSRMLRSTGKTVEVYRVPQQYVLSTRATHEVLIVGTNSKVVAGG